MNLCTAAFLVTCLLVPSGSIAATSNAPSGDPDRAVSAAPLAATADIGSNETNAMTDKETAMVVGAGWQSEFWCGVAAGAGMVLTATGVLTPVGIALGGAGIYCALYP